jgi:hypothetical protein
MSSVARRCSSRLWLLSPPQRGFVRRQECDLGCSPAPGVVCCCWGAGGNKFIIDAFFLQNQTTTTTTTTTTWSVLGCQKTKVVDKSTTMPTSHHRYYHERSKRTGGVLPGPEVLWVPRILAISDIVIPIRPNAFACTAASTRCARDKKEKLVSFRGGEYCTGNR